MMLSSLNTKPLVNASLIQPPCCEPAVPRPHPPLECLSSVQQTPFGVSSVQGVCGRGSVGGCVHACVHTYVCESVQH